MELFLHVASASAGYKTPKSEQVWFWTNASPKPRAKAIIKIKYWVGYNNDNDVVPSKDIVESFGNVK